MPDPQLLTCRASDSMRERMGLMPEPVAKIKRVGKASGGHLSTGKPLPMTGLAWSSLPACDKALLSDVPVQLQHGRTGPRCERDGHLLALSTRARQYPQLA